MLVVDSDVVTDNKTLLNLWKHECTRVISDRFISSTDKEWFEKAIKNVAEEDLGPELAALMDDEPYFVDFLRDAPEMTGTSAYYFQIAFDRLVSHAVALIFSESGCIGVMIRVIIHSLLFFQLK